MAIYCRFFFIFLRKIADLSKFTFIFVQNIIILTSNFTIMNKTELVNAIAEKANLTKVDAKNALDACLSAIAEALEKDDKVALLGFGTFSVSEKGARTGINPRTKETINIPARKAVKFKPGAELANKVN